MSPSRVRRTVAAIVAIAASIPAALTLAVLGPTTEPAHAADLSLFDPGFIISDAIFYDSSTMSASDIQAFLTQKGSGCMAGSDGTPCLKDYHQTTTTRAADSRCTGQYTGASNESAAQIIAKVAVACGINPRVLIVFLQKEEGLVTAATGSAVRYRSAMGYGCPDSSVCNALYYGFFNQVYAAASQFRNYANNPTSYGHRAGMTNNILFNPNPACGSSSVFIQNQATASLYNYTPYQPNPAALAAGYGTGDACSAYGNRNFWNYFRDWFGPTTDRLPIGWIDSVTTTATSITVTGWALDPDTTDPIAVHVWIGSSSAAFMADGARPDVGAVFHKGDNHGFTATVPATLGTFNVCIYGINNWPPGGNAQIGCRTVTVVNHAPIGFIDSVTTAPGSITMTGWALDPDTTDPITVQMAVDSASAAFTANQARPDIGTIFGLGSNHGYTTTMSATTGTHTVCLTAINATPGTNPQFGCRTITVPPTAEANRAPIGFIDSVTTAPGSITMTGWALDPDTTDPITVQMAVDSASAAFTANQARPDIGTIFGLGSNHGYTTTMSATTGTHTVCLTAINATPGTNPQFGCRTITVPPS
jgi:hypothetical protein